MKHHFRGVSLCVVTLVILLSAFSQVRAQYTPGNLVVLQTGDGSTTLSSAAAPLFLKEYNTSTASQAIPVSSVTIPSVTVSSTSNPLTNAGTAITEGQMTLSSDRTKIVIAGYNADAGTVAVAGLSSAAVARAIDTVGYVQTPGRADTSQTAFSGTDINGAARNGGENYWAVGGSTGVYYMGNSAPPASVFTATTSLRAINTFNNKLYFSTASGLSRIGRINSQLASGIASADTLITLGSGTTPQPYGFVVNNAESIVYVADDRASAAGGGIQKWILNGSTWALAYTLNVGTGLGARSVIADWNTVYPTLYAITTATGGSLIRIVDSNLSATPFTLASGTATAVFRSVAFVPIDPNCASFNATITVSGTTTRCQGDSVTLTANSGTGYKYQWNRNGIALSKDTLQVMKASIGGSYSVTVTTPAKCTAISSAVAITINPAPSTIITPNGPLAFCTNGSVQLCGPTQAGSVYLWRKNFATIPASVFPCITVNTSGNYKIFITNSTTGCMDSSLTAVVTVSSPASAAITPPGFVAFCVGSTIRLHTNSAPGLSYTWKRNDTVLTGTGNTDSTLLAGIPGIYKVIVSAPAPGCVDSASDTVAISLLPNTHITKLSADTVCGGDTVFVRAAGGLRNTYQWEISGVGISPAQADSNYFLVTLVSGVTTTIQYRVIVTSQVGCRDSSAYQTVTVVPPPVPPVIVSAGGTMDAGIYKIYQWYLNGIPIPGAIGQTYVPTVNGMYTVTISNGYCTRSSAPFPVSGLGVKDALANAGIFIYPNPVRDILRIDAPNEVHVVIKDIRGREVLRANGMTRISLGSLDEGVYTVSIYSMSGIFLGAKLVTRSGN